MLKALNASLRLSRSMTLTDLSTSHPTMPTRIRHQNSSGQRSANDSLAAISSVLMISL